MFSNKQPKSSVHACLNVSNVAPVMSIFNLVSLKNIENIASENVYILHTVLFI